MRLATLLTCHNRCQQTLACLDALCHVAPDAEVYLTDDGSTDGTAEAVLALHPAVHIVRGDGNLFWSRGMYEAWREALRGDCDYYLWLNDDVTLYPGAVRELLACSDEGRRVVSGLVEEAATHKVIYGGYDAQKRLIGIAAEPQLIVWMNGNVVLVSRQVVQQIGILDPYYQHDLGDVDYGMRARETGIEVVSTRMVVAAGSRNDVCRVRRRGTSLIGRFRYLNSPLGSPLKQNFHFRRRHFGLLHALAYCTHLVLLNLLPDGLVNQNVYR